MRRLSQIAGLLFLAVSASWCVTASASVWYVSVNKGDQQGDGKHWDTAYADLQSALDHAQSGDEIWVAEGTYTPVHGEGRSKTFRLVEGVSLYGGFSGQETTLKARDWERFPTVLSGAVDDTDGVWGHVYHVVTGADGAVLDGFIIEKGCAMPDFRQKPTAKQGDRSGQQHTTPGQLMAGGHEHDGGGLINVGVSMTVRHSLFRYNLALKGGAMYNLGQKVPGQVNSAGLSSGRVLVEDVTFYRNAALSRGGGVANDLQADVHFSRTQWLENYSGGKGGGQYNDFNSSPVIEDGVFYGNQAGLKGGALVADGSSCPLLYHVTVLNNEAWDRGGGLYAGTYGHDKPPSCVTLVDSLVLDNSSALADEDNISGWQLSEVHAYHSIVRHDSSVHMIETSALPQSFLEMPPHEKVERCDLRALVSGPLRQVGLALPERLLRSGQRYGDVALGRDATYVGSSLSPWSGLVCHPLKEEAAK